MALSAEQLDLCEQFAEELIIAKVDGGEWEQLVNDAGQTMRLLVAELKSIRSQGMSSENL